MGHSGAEICGLGLPTLLNGTQMPPCRLPTLHTLLIPRTGQLVLSHKSFQGLGLLHGPLTLPAPVSQVHFLAATHVLWEAYD